MKSVWHSCPDIPVPFPPTPTPIITHGMWLPGKGVTLDEAAHSGGRPDGVELVALPQQRGWAATPLFLKGHLGGGPSPPSQMSIFGIRRNFQFLQLFYL